MKFEIDLNEHDGHRAATENLTRLQTDLADAKREQTELMSQLGRGHDIESEVEGALKGEPVTLTVVNRDRIAQLSHEQRVLTEAIERAKRVLSEERGRASKQIHNQARPEYAKIVKRIAQILASLREVCVEEREFRHALIDSGAYMINDFILPVADCGEPGTDGVRSDLIARWERDAKAAGYI
jgi:hypothetical protein